MCALVEGLRRRVCAVARLGIVMAVACLGSGCEAMVKRQYSHDVGELSNAERIEVTFAYRPDPVSGALQLPPAITITDPHRVAAAAAFAGRYRNGWRSALTRAEVGRDSCIEARRVVGVLKDIDDALDRDGHARHIAAAVPISRDHIRE